jgi:hypothetical protein
MLCTACGTEIPEDQRVGLNGFEYHADPCFAAGLRGTTLKPRDIVVALAPTMPPMVAYKAGLSFVGAIVGARRTAKKKAAQ